MLVAEGVGRVLDPEINMWQMARPLIEQWMRENLGPQARVKESVGAVLASLESLPRLVAHAEKTVEALRYGGLKLHPESLNAMQNGGRRKGMFPSWLPWVLVAGLTFLLLRR